MFAVGWNLAEDLALRTEITAQLFYGAATSWTGDIDWAIAGDSWVASADDLLAASVIDCATHTAIITTFDAGGLYRLEAHEGTAR